ncbi:MAG: alpha amylase N-terminal ig-like domain-containing protein [Acidimicrobiia bacterium]|nr:alpha amylase N-terminal ig-like domain-containing protein [Acidimicrobiia bacterium]
MPRPYFPDARYYGENASLYPADLRYDPADRACCDPRPDGSVLFRLRAEAGFTAANLVLEDGSGHPMECWACTERFSFWEVVLPSGRRRFSYTFALKDSRGRAVYLVPAGVSNAVERLDRWSLDLDAVAPLAVPSASATATRPSPRRGPTPGGARPIGCDSRGAIWWASPSRPATWPASGWMSST